MRYEEFFLNFAVIMQQKDNSHKSWAQGKKPSMKRRCADNNYTERGLYLITIATEGRQSLLGTLVEKAEATEGPDKPHVVLSPFLVPLLKSSTAEVEPQPKHSPIGTLWEPGYNDRLLLHKNQLAHMLAYLDDNPRRLLLKRQHPEFFSPLGTIHRAFSGRLSSLLQAHTSLSASLR